ncbi:Four-helix bundle copper-binding protein [Hyphomicrobium sp. 1Nfss2.1]|uniref:four-helix bundle copper-binding protein n=1 Tax=Hyphomicrobium sp. 1Nfss2.1 TaxID=3413936 RepID=UPI003C7C5F7C
MTDSIETTEQTSAVNRRAILAALAASGTALAASSASAQEGHDHHHMDHGGGSHGAPPAHLALINAALDCMKKGEICANHCIDLLGDGDKAMKDCLRSVSTMLPACAALARLGALDAKRLKEFAKVCADICSDCQAECKKHAEHHAECKACGEACGVCADECKKLI